MTAYTGSWLVAPRLGRPDTTQVVLAKISWSGAALASGDTLTVADLTKLGETIIAEDVELFGTLPDTNATQTSGFKVGVTGDDDAFLAAIVINQRGQLFLKGTGASVGVGTIGESKDLIVTVTANAATGVTSGDVFVKLTIRSRV